MYAAALVAANFTRDYLDLGCNQTNENWYELFFFIFQYISTDLVIGEAVCEKEY